jgi:tetratricopeptide (TPR) repeat protein
MRLRHLNWSLALLAVSGLFFGEVAAQQVTVQALIERGALEEAVQRAERERDNVESTYLAAQAFTKMNDPGRAAEEYARLRDAGDEAWKAIGESGALMSEGNMGAAMAAAERAVAASGDNPYAHYQVAAVASRQNNYARAAEEFTRAAELKPDLAYAHYYAGLAYQRVKNVPKMSEHFEAFLRLAPDAPERAAVASVLRTLRPRN